MDFILWVMLGLALLIVVWFSVLSVIGWFATKFFGKNEAWLDYGIDEDDLL